MTGQLLKGKAKNLDRPLLTAAVYMQADEAKL